MTSATPIDDRMIARRLAAARAIAEDAAALAMAMRPPPGGPTGTTKGMQDYLTETDGAVEKLIAERLNALYPEDGFMGEEAGSRRSGTLTWVVDPIDGTSNYARGRERWCISIGLMHGKLPVAGVIHAPALHEIYTAQRGHGAFLNGKRIKASDIADTRTAMVEMGWSPKVTPDVYAKHMRAFMSLGVMPRSCGSGALAIADVACGRQEAYLELVINLWDVAAGMVLLHEAGAVTSPFLEIGGLTGGALLFTAAPAIAGELARAAEVALD
ncbi:inositol monophosphatase family protein [Brytella acorum]|uniref:Inositol-1-monophosphatase n=1 Tax=Brytella acorum TaxID=2959299 RepID=A0AA35UZ92_9PROT|nr:inositol monophosphatase family protein [Brytella acorum]MDF3623953.1 inositol monophosphatase family protein [Brytella acorum]CAI9122207.1 inositol monophosphatase family protein [Brytella acorum]